MDTVEMLYRFAPYKFIQVAKETANYYEFVAYLKRLPNFHIVDDLSDAQLKLLYGFAIADLQKENKG